MHAGAFTFGLVVGVLVCALVLLTSLMRYIQSDTESFKRWLDRDASA